MNEERRRSGKSATPFDLLALLGFVLVIFVLDLLAAPLAELRKLGWRGRADICEPVREEDDAVHLFRVEILSQLGGPFLDAGIEGRRAAFADPGDLALHGLLIINALWRNENFHLVVVDNEREDVVRAKLIDGNVGRLLGFLKLRSGHRARAVEDEGKVDRHRPLGVGLLGAQFDLNDRIACSAGEEVFPFRLDEKSDRGTFGRREKRERRSRE